jgi:hypothetical protein
MEKLEFDAVLEKHENRNAAYIKFPYNVQEVYGAKGQVKVKAWIDGVFYRGSLAAMGYRFHCLGVTQSIRKQIGKQPGDNVHIVLERDIEERVINIPEDLLELLNQNTELKTYFDSLAFSHKREYVNWIFQAKKNDTRQNRLQKTIEMLTNKKRKLNGK